MSNEPRVLEIEFNVLRNQNTNQFMVGHTLRWCDDSWGFGFVNDLKGEDEALARMDGVTKLYAPSGRVVVDSAISGTYRERGFEKLERDDLHLFTLALDAGEAAKYFRP